MERREEISDVFKAGGGNDRNPCFLWPILLHSLVFKNSAQA
jgi:hypothetical protein